MYNVLVVEYIIYKFSILWNLQGNNPSQHFWRAKGNTRRESENHLLKLLRLYMKYEANSRLLIQQKKYPFFLLLLILRTFQSSWVILFLQANHTEIFYLSQIKIWPINQLWGKGVSKSLQVSCFTVGYKKVGTWERGALKSRKKRGVGERRHRRLHLSAARSHRKPT